MHRFLPLARGRSLCCRPMEPKYTPTRKVACPLDGEKRHREHRAAHLKKLLFLQENVRLSVQGARFASFFFKQDKNAQLSTRKQSVPPEQMFGFCKKLFNFLKENVLLSTGKMLIPHKRETMGRLVDEYISYWENLSPYCSAPCPP